MRRRLYLTPILTVLLIILGLWVVLPNNPGIHIGSINKPIETRLGLDLVGGVQALLQADIPEDTAVSRENMETAKTVVDNRVNGLGVTEAIVQLAGDRRIVVELPGETDPETALATIKQTGLLEFVDLSQISSQEAMALVGQKIVTDFASSGSDDSATQGQVFHTVMTGAELSPSGINVIATQTGQPEVAFELTSDGSQVFAQHTSQNIGNVLAIVLDKEVISTPVIQSAITDGRGVISGNFDIDSANNLAVQLRYGSLPVPLIVASSQTIGPTLGKDSMQKSLFAGVIGVGVVMVYMAFYYRFPGLLADLALLLYILFTFAIFKLIPVTLTLPGIAGFILSIGVAVDANILIFERLKEELRDGKTLRNAIDAGWKRAWPSIRDSNFSTLITCGILFWFGNTFGASIVKGFSFTLAIGVLVSMFTAIVVTRTILHLILDQIDISRHLRMFGVQEI